LTTAHRHQLVGSCDFRSTRNSLQHRAQNSVEPRNKVNTTTTTTTAATAIDVHVNSISDVIADISIVCVVDVCITSH
jgi:hypothetical protein